MISTMQSAETKMPHRRRWKAVLLGSGVILAFCLVVVTGFLSVAASITWIYILASGSAAAFGAAAYQLRKAEAFLTADEAAWLVASGDPAKKDFLATLDRDDD